MSKKKRVIALVVVGAFDGLFGMLWSGWSWHAAKLSRYDKSSNRPYWDLGTLYAMLQVCRMIPRYCLLWLVTPHDLLGFVHHALAPFILFLAFVCHSSVWWVLNYQQYPSGFAATSSTFEVHVSPWFQLQLCLLHCSRSQLWIIPNSPVSPHLSRCSSHTSSVVLVSIWALENNLLYLAPSKVETWILLEALICLLDKTKFVIGLFYLLSFLFVDMYQSCWGWSLTSIPAREFMAMECWIWGYP